MENYGILEELVLTRPGGEPMTRILPLLKISTIITTFWSALSTWMANDVPVLPDPVFFLVEVRDFKQWRTELSERFRSTNIIPVFIYLHNYGVTMGHVEGPPAQVGDGASVISKITDIRSL